MPTKKKSKRKAQRREQDPFHEMQNMTNMAIGATLGMTALGTVAGVAGNVLKK